MQVGRRGTENEALTGNKRVLETRKTANVGELLIRAKQEINSRLILYHTHAFA